MEKLQLCPVCNSELSSGWIGERGWIRWYEKPRGAIAFWCLGRNLLPATSSRWRIDKSKKEAKKCSKCGLVIFNSEFEEKSLLRRLMPFLVAVGGIVGVLTVTFVTLFPPGRPPVPPAATVLRTVTPSDAYRYFSGYYKTHSNHPTIYAHAGRERGAEELTILGPETEQTFSMQDADKAFQAYKQLLIRRGFKP